MIDDMMTGILPIAEYVEYIERGEIPPAPHVGSSPGGWHRKLASTKDVLASFRARDRCAQMGLWIVVDRQWTKTLAEWIGDRLVLEVMAGAGFLAKALADHGATIVATDDYSSYNTQHTDLKLVYHVEERDAVNAVLAYPDAEILLVSWPPYADETITDVCETWGTDRPIVYIGEDECGCNAPASFWARFWEDPDVPNIPLFSWEGIHDRVYIGYWKKRGIDDA